MPWVETFLDYIYLDQGEIQSIVKLLQLYVIHQDQKIEEPLKYIQQDLHLCSMIRIVNTKVRALQKQIMEALTALSGRRPSSVDLNRASLNPCARALLVLLEQRPTGARLTQGQLIPSLESRFSESNIKLQLSNLVKKKLLTNCSKCRPKGYGLPTWPCAHVGSRTRNGSED
jgi:hypothetical protein